MPLGKRKDARACVPLKHMKTIRKIHKTGVSIKEAKDAGKSLIRKTSKKRFCMQFCKQNPIP
jgi:hypothetical protein